MATKSRVIMVWGNRILSRRGEVDQEVLQTAVDLALPRLVAASSSAAAWGSLFSSRDTVGIKVNCIGGRLLSPSPSWVTVLVQGLKQAGLEEERIIFWDRSSRELKEAGFPLRQEGRGVRCFGTDSPGAGYGSEPMQNGSYAGLISRIVTHLTSAQIGLCLLKDHNLSGLSGALKNLYGAIHNPNKYHDHHCNPYLADLYGLPPFRQKFRLFICEAARVQYHGGPGFKSRWIEDYGAILFSLDPVALDYVGWQLLDRIRRAHGLPTLEEEGRPPAYILTAGDAAHRLGKCSWSEIELLELTA